MHRGHQQQRRGCWEFWMLNSSRMNPRAALPVIYSVKHPQKHLSDAASPLLITGSNWFLQALSFRIGAGTVVTLCARVG